MSADLHIRIDDDVIALIEEYKVDNKIQSTNEAVNRLLVSTLKENNEETMQKLNELEDLIMEGNKASYANLNILSFIYKDLATVITRTCDIASRRHRYWREKSVKDIFMFFRKVGNGCVALPRINFWKNYKFACVEPYVQDGKSEDVLGITQDKYNELVTGVNDTSAIRTKNLDE